MIVQKSFYTNCRSLGDDIVYRGIHNGKRVLERIKYSPTLFVPSNSPNKFKTLLGQDVAPIKFETMSEARQFLDKYKDVENFKIYGNTTFHFCYLSDLFPNTIEYDLSLISIAYLDIEVGSENGFSEVSVASEPVTAITVKMNNRNLIAYDNIFIITQHLPVCSQIEIKQ